MCTRHATEVAVARMSYLFAGARTKCHYNVCFTCYAEYSRANLVDLKYYPNASPEAHAMAVARGDRGV